MKQNLLNRFLLAIATVFLLFSMNANAEELPDTKGREFWLTFLPNLHNSLFENYPFSARFLDSLYIYVSSDEPTSGTITFNNPNGTIENINFNITDVSRVYTFGIPFVGYELEGFNKTTFIDYSGDNDNERISNKSFLVRTEKDVTVYAHQQAITTSESMTVLPKDAIGSKYFVLSYNSDGSTDFFGRVQTNSTPSQFAIVATEDNTEITITPSTPTFRNGADVQNITLNRGEVYLVQALIDSRSVIRDLSGTKVEASRPVAIFSGHQRSRLPNNSNGLSRDMLLEQLPPVSTWGSQIIVAPFAQTQSISSSGDDIFRIMAGEDNTDIIIDGNGVATLDEGEFLEYSLIQASLIEANGPIMVLQYKKTSQSGNTSASSDPFMTYSPPIQQYGNYYKTVNIQASEPATGLFQVYDEHYLMIITKNQDIGSIRIDGANVNAAQFRGVALTDWSYANIRVSEGIHILESANPFGLTVYGYGQANSYGYFGGMNLKIIDNRTPKLLSSSDCFTVTGTATDSTDIDSRLAEVISNPNTIDNVNLTIEEFEPYAETVDFTAELVDIYQDGFFQITARDSAGQVTTESYDIPGFTVALTQEPATIYENRIFQTLCADFSLTNYGRFPQTVNLLELTNNNPNIFFSNLDDSDFPLTLQPDEVYEFEICFYSDDAVEVESLLRVEGDCADRELASIVYSSETDENDPTISGSSDPCDLFHEVTILDNQPTDFGISEINLIELENIKAVEMERTIKTASYSFSVINPYEDAYFEIEVLDSVGNTASYSKVIPGFTIEFNGVRGDLDGYNIREEIFDFGNVDIGVRYCDYITIFNYGNFAKTLDNTYFAKQLLFSVPTNQLPITIEPNESIELQICYRPLIANEEEEFDEDELFIGDNCFEFGMPAKGVAEPLFYSGNSKCDIPLEITASSVSNVYLLEQNAPNPGAVETGVIYAVPEESQVQINIYNVFGENVKEVFNQYHSPGFYEVRIDLTDFDNGVYFYELVSGSNRLIRKMIIQK